jgi:hypothetical protein
MICEISFTILNRYHSDQKTFRKWGPLIARQRSLLRASSPRRICWIFSRSSTGYILSSGSIAKQSEWCSIYLRKKGTQAHYYVINPQLCLQHVDLSSP